MFKWGHPIQEGTELFDRTVVAPPILRIKIHIPPAKPDTGSPLITTQKPDSDTVRKSLTLIAKKILDRERANIVQWSLSQRQNNSLGDMKVVKTQARFSGVDAFYSRSHEKEQLDLTVFPVPPKEKPEDNLQLLILHNNNKITAVSMVALDAASKNGFQNLTATHKAILDRSSWGADLIKVSQYKFDTVLGTMLLSPVVVSKENTLRKAEKHHICAMISKLTHFVETSTLEKRTPRFNGSDGIVYTPNDMFGLERRGSSVKLVRTGDGGNGAFPYAISEIGTYYYAPVSYSDKMVFYSVDPYETLANTTVRMAFNANVSVEATDELYGTIKVGTSGSYYGDFSGFPAPLFIVPTIEDPSPWVGYSTSDYLNGNEVEYEGYTGYGVYVNGSYETVHTHSEWVRHLTPIFNPFPPPEVSNVLWFIENTKTDFSQSLPFTTFRQNDNNLDVVEVVMSPVTADYYNYATNPQAPANTITNRWSFNFLHYTSGETTSFFTRVSAIPPDLTFDHRFTTRLVTYPPSLGMDDGDYYFFDTYTLRTPYGQIAVDPEVIAGVFPSARFFGDGEYNPWVHLSNGRVMIQGFEVASERHVWYRGPKKDDAFPEPVEITNMLAAIAETEITNIQALIIDVPLARIREFV